MDIPLKAIIIGASSGIGKALALELAKRNYHIGLTGRRENLLHALAAQSGTTCYIKVMDITRVDQAQAQLKELISQMNGVDIVIISAGVGSCDLDWEEQREIIDTNVRGFTALSCVALDYFLKENKGHLVGISSIAALRGGAGAPAYTASKAFVSNYLDGLRARIKRMKKNICITHVQPGLVDTAMGQASSFWRATPQKAALQIVHAIHRKSRHAYITKRWRLIAWFFKYAPDFLFYTFF